MPVYLVDPGGELKQAYSWEGAVFAPAQGGTYPIPAALIEAVKKLEEYIAARQPKPAENGGTPSNGATVSEVQVPTRMETKIESSGGETSPSPPRLPDGFPGKSELEAADVTTIDGVQQRVDAGTLTDITGIGPQTATQIETYLQTYAES